jgi:prevent-host-death family protein
MKVAIREAKNQLSKYGNMAHSGEKVTVCKNGKPWFDLVPHEAKCRIIAPIVNGAPCVKVSEATSPVDANDIEGWI